MSHIKLVITTGDDGRTRLSLASKHRWIEREIYVDLTNEQAEQVAMNLLSRSMRSGS